MTIETDDDLQGMQRVGRAVAQAREAMLAAASEGVTTRELDDLGRSILHAHGARSAPELAYSFPAATCISVNRDFAHGIPSDYRLKSGDLVNIDVSAELDGYWADTGASMAIGQPSVRDNQLLQSTRLALRDALQQARPGNRVNQIGRAIERRARRHGFFAVANLGGHGIGRFIHEAPEVANTFDRRDRTVMHEGMVLAIEPFLSTGATWVHERADGWTLGANDNSRCAQYEHTIVVQNGQPLILTAA